MSTVLIPDPEALASIQPDLGQAPKTSVVSGRGSLLWLRIALVLVACAAVIGIGTASDPTMRYGLIVGIIYAIAVLGSNAVTGVLGEISLSQGAFMACGAYLCVIGLEQGWPFWLALVVSVLVTAFLGALVAIPTVRLEGIFTALVTFALAFAVPDLIIQFRDQTGGQAGLPVPSGLTLVGQPVGGSDLTSLVVIVVVFALAAVTSLLALHGRIGRVLVTIGEGGPAAECFGVRSRMWQVVVWTWASALGALAGVFFAVTVGYLTPEVFPVMLSIMVLVGTVVGGARSALGALIGGLLIGTVPPELQSVMPAETTGILFGAILLLALLAGHGGVNSFIERVLVFGWSLARRDRNGAS